MESSLGGCTGPRSTVSAVAWIKELISSLPTKFDSLTIVSKVPSEF